MSEHYFDRHGRAGKLSEAQDRYRSSSQTPSDACAFLSVIYSAMGSKEWPTITYAKRARYLCLGVNTARKALRGVESLTADQCDVLSTILLRTAERSRAVFLWSMAHEVAHRGLGKLMSSLGRPGDGGHTYSLLLNTIAHCYIHRRNVIEAEQALMESFSSACYIKHPDQKSRAYRGIALGYAKLGMRVSAGDSLLRMDEAGAREGFRWPDTAYKNKKAKDKVMELLKRGGSM